MIYKLIKLAIPLLCCIVLHSCNADTNFPNTGTALAAIFWRRMMNRDPFLAAESTMYWRNLSARNPKEASTKALSARMETAKDPEGMLQNAFIYRSKRELSPKYKTLTDHYWRNFAANDPEISARFSMYWIENRQADMYW